MVVMVGRSNQLSKSLIDGIYGTQRVTPYFHSSNIPLFQLNRLQFELIIK